MNMNAFLFSLINKACNEPIDFTGVSEELVLIPNMMIQFIK